MRRSADLQHHPHVDDDEAAREEGGLPLDVAVRPEPGQRLDPGVAGRDAEDGGEGAVELAEVVGRDVGEERDPQDRVCAARAPRPPRPLPAQARRSSRWRPKKNRVGAQRARRVGWRG